MTRREQIFLVLAIFGIAIGGISVSMGWSGCAKIKEPVGNRVIEILKGQEGFRGQPYDDALGYASIGYGTRLPLTEAEATLLLEHRLDGKTKDLARRWHPFADQPYHVRQALSLLAYQIGVEGELKFHNMLFALKTGDIDEAVNQALDSKWARQTPKRAEKVVELFRSGEVAK